MTRRHEGNSVIVTGAAGSIGFSTCEILAREGARVIAIQELWTVEGKPTPGLLVHPKGEKATLAESKAWLAEIDALRAERGDLKSYKGGKLYERRDLFEAAVMTFRAVLTDYATSEFADDALLGAVRAQNAYAENSVADKQADRFREALSLYDQLVTLFPTSSVLGEAETQYDRAYRGLRSTGETIEEPAAAATEN